MYSFNIFSILSLATAEIYVVLSVYILLKNPRNLANILFFFLAITMAIWGAGEGMQRAALDASTALLWAVYVVGFGSALFPVALLHFWLVYSEVAKKISKYWILAIYVPAIFLMVVRFFFTPMLITGVELQYWGYSTAGTKYYILAMAYVAIYSIIVISLAFWTVRKSQGQFKSQAKYIAWGVLVAMIAGMSTQLTRPIFHMNIPEMTVVSTFVFIVMIAYAVNKFGLLTITTSLVAENILSTITDFIIAVDKNKNISYVNKALLDILGYDDKEVISQPMDVLVKNKISSLNFDDLHKSFPLTNYETEIRTKNGELIPVSANGSVLKEGPGNVLGLVFVLRDIREINQVIQNLKSKTKELEKAKGELESSKQELEERNDQLEKFNKIAVGREMKMIELKDELNKLKEGGQ